MVSLVAGLPGQAAFLEEGMEICRHASSIVFRDSEFREVKGQGIPQVTDAAKEP